MTKTVLVITLILLSTSVLSSDWIAVEGGVREIDLKEKEVEHGLWKYLLGRNEFEFLPSEKYIYQYQVKSENELYINAFCDSFGKKNLHEEFLVVMDGGTCFFQVMMNMETGEFNLIYVNGEA